MMDRRSFVQLVITAGVVGLVAAARIYNDPSGQPVARLVSSNGRTWYRWDGGKNGSHKLEGESALIRESEYFTKEEIAQLVKDGYAEYL